MTFEEWLLFMTIWTAVSVPLGPNALNCIATAAEFGFKKSLWSVGGVFVAANIHMLIAMVGLAAFVAANPIVFEFIRWLGVGYLVWMGISMFRARGRLSDKQQKQPKTAGQLLRQAIFISLSNPKSVFVWLVVFSQFVDAGRPLAPQLQILAPSALIVTIVVYVGYCALGTGAKQLFSGHRKRWFDRATGSIYLGFAMMLASADIRKS